MPKGQKKIDWTPKNNAKLMLTILVIENIYPNCEKVAVAFSGVVNAMAISNRLSRLRKKAADDDLMPKAGVTVPAKGPKGTAASNKGNGGEEGGKNEASDRKGSDSSSIRKGSAKSQKVLTGRVTKARTPGKKNAKSNDMISDNAEMKVGDNRLNDGVGSRAEDGDEFEKNIALRIKKKDVD